MIPESRCSGKKTSRELCDMRFECKFFLGNYHVDKQKKMKTHSSDISVRHCTINGYTNFEDISDV